eukprot:TRINITY_DN839_c0_g1_i3.p1 TRINITY_DN839_c0_g1~~TRINITY_DN839_c0_g1_i3.p1  ORF type:complete len:454 (+),score=69.57 TRINITY_DN839_c0_g1_i3:91-1452(+)
MSLFGNIFGGSDQNGDGLFSTESKFRSGVAPGRKTEIKFKKRSKSDEKQKTNRNSNIEEKLKSTNTGLTTTGQQEVIEYKEDQDKMKKRKRRKIALEDQYEVVDGKVKKKQKQKDEEIFEEMENGVQQEERDESDSEDEVKTKRERREERAQYDPEEKKRTAFVGNLPVAVKQKQVRKLFSECGEIETVRFRSLAFVEDLKVPKFVASRRRDLLNQEHTSKNALIKFKDASGVEKAKLFNMRVLSGHHIRVSGMEDDEFDPKRTIFIGNLHPKVQDEVVIQLFNGDQVGSDYAGQVEGLRIVRERGSQACKGFGFVLFKTKKVAKQVLKLSDTLEIGGRKIRIEKVDTSSSKSTYNSAANERRNKNVTQTNQQGRSNKIDKSQSWQGIQTKGKQKSIRGNKTQFQNRGNIGQGIQGKINFNKRYQGTRKQGKRPAVVEKKRKQLLQKAMLKGI